MNIVLVGLMGSGKSAVGRALAETLGRPFVDTDDLIQQQAGHTIPQIFAEQGEAAFRRLESRVITQVVTAGGRGDVVIATGGGAVVDPTNREALRQAGLVVWLDAPPEELIRRAKAEGLEGRPLLAGPDPLQRLRALADNRAEAYRGAAHHRIDTAGKTVAEVATAILDLLKEKR